MSFYSDLAADALEILTEFGQVVEFQRKAAGEYIPGVGVSTHSSSYQATLVVEELDLSEISGAGDFLQVGDIKATASTTEPPAIGDTATINGKAWRIQNVSPIAPAGEVVVYELFLRY